MKLQRLSLFFIFSLFSPSVFSITGNASYQFPVASGTSGSVVTATSTSNTMVAFPVAGAPLKLNLADLTASDLTVPPNTGATLSPNASGTSGISTKTCASNISWLPSLTTPTVDASGNFSSATTPNGLQTNITVSCAGYFGCIFKYSPVYSTPQTNPSLASTVGTGGNLSFTKSSGSSSYVYLTIDQFSGMGVGITSSNLVQVAWTGAGAGGSYSITTLNVCI